jgi:hypothetical protein
MKIVNSVGWLETEVDVVYWYTKPQKERQHEYGWDPALPAELEIDQILYKGVDVKDLFHPDDMDYFLMEGWEHINDDGSDL